VIVAGCPLGGNPFEHLEVDVVLDSLVLVISPQGPGDLGQGLQVLEALELVLFRGHAFCGSSKTM